MSQKLTIQGTITSNPSTGTADKYNVKFLWNGQLIDYYAKASVAVPAFSSASGAITIHYTDPSGGQFYGTPSFGGVIGAGKINLALDNGVTMDGDISGGPETQEKFYGMGNMLL